ncbi:hypothetical protein M0R88_05430 [Halorussus gelatinilyticus]|uniref:Uncharacterized protein n=1 Tax=Halorussus gelatinilyticus TaxID=2937524 RepID=A0A8U0ILM1_9EURY|nr:hypothetical protein [Halorussus gelatinilyticus]UPW01545.1 hypothetical protein M0R88_05430 [Halorussus gelatinilyticus]
MRSMKRRQFGAMLATATFSIGGVSSAAADASAQETEPLQIEDVSVDLGEATASVGRATFRYQNGTMRLQLNDWSMETGSKSLSIARARVDVSDVSAETYATVRAAMVEAYEGQSLSPLLSALAEADVDPESGIQVTLGPVRTDGTLLANKVVATGTVGNVVPSGTRDLLTGGASLSALASLGASKWSELSIKRRNATLTANDVTMQLDGTTFAISSPSGTAKVSSRTFEFSDLTLNIMPPETIPAPHVQFLSQVRQLGADGNLTLSAIKSAAADAGVTVANTLDAIRSAMYELSFGQVTENGEEIASNFQTSGTVAELMQTVRKQAGMDQQTGDQQDDQQDDDQQDDDQAQDGQLSKVAVVSSPNTDEQMNYVFEVTGDLENLEPNEDGGAAVDLISETDGRVRVEGTVGEGDDRFAFSGDLIEVDVPDAVQIETSER